MHALQTMAMARALQNPRLVRMVLLNIFFVHHNPRANTEPSSTLAVAQLRALHLAFAHFEALLDVATGQQGKKKKKRAQMNQWLHSAFILMFIFTFLSF